MSLLPALLCAALLSAQPPAAPGASVSGPPVTRSATPIIDPKAEALLRANEKAMYALKSYSAECFIEGITAATPKSPRQENYRKATLTAAKPALMRFMVRPVRPNGNGALTMLSDRPDALYLCDGTSWVQQDDTRYSRQPFRNPAQLRTTVRVWDGVHSPANSLRASLSRYRKEGKLTQLRLAGRQVVEGVPCDVIAFRIEDAMRGTRITLDYQLFLGSDKLARRFIEQTAFNDVPRYEDTTTIRNIRTNFAAPPPAAFRYKPTADVISYAEAEAKRPKLLAAGTPAPDFTVEGENGKPVKLSDFRGKTVVLDFWATWCGPCMSAMPATNAAGKKFSDSSVVVLAVNVWDEKPAYDAWVPENQAKYDAIRFLRDPSGRRGLIAKTLYNVTGIPTQYVIDPQGIIRASFVGYDDNPKPLEDAITKASASEGK